MTTVLTHCSLLKMKTPVVLVLCLLVIAHDAVSLTTPPLTTDEEPAQTETPSPASLATILDLFTTETPAETPATPPTPTPEETTTPDFTPEITGTSATTEPPTCSPPVNATIIIQCFIIIWIIDLRETCATMKYCIDQYGFDICMSCHLTISLCSGTGEVCDQFCKNTEPPANYGVCKDGTPLFCPCQMPNAQTCICY